jgi:dynein light chain roadblock-type
MPAELEHTLALLTGHRSVLGYLLLSRGAPLSIIRHVGAIFDGEQGRRYARAVGRIVDAVREGLDEIAGDRQDKVRFGSDVSNGQY